MSFQAVKEKWKIHSIAQNHRTKRVTINLVRGNAIASFTAIDDGNYGVGKLYENGKLLDSIPLFWRSLANSDVRKTFGDVEKLLLEKRTDAKI